MEFKGHTLNPFQVQAVRAIRSGRDVLLAAPTGAGKTLVAEYAIEEAVGQGRKAIYTSPIKALSGQKFRDFTNDGVDVGLMTGDLSLHPQAPVVIMTTEIFRNSVFEDPDRFRDVDFVIFDEIHFLDDRERGTVWEESLIFAPPHLRFVCLSATIHNLEQFGEWVRTVRKHPLEVIRHGRRPVPLAHRLFHEASGMFQLAQRKQAVQRARRTRNRSRGPRQRNGRGGRRGRQPRAYQLLLDELQTESLVPILFFCFSRKECEIKADRNMHRRLLGRGDRARIRKLFTDICRLFELSPDADPSLSAILRRAEHGVGYHHAGMLPIHKEVVERLFTSGILKLLFTTETFALGINMPARTVVFDSLKKFDGVQVDYMRTRDYLQMAGRAGRQGIDKHGLVVSVLEEDDLDDAPLSRFFGSKVEPIVSRFNLSYATILNLFEHMGSKLVEAYDRSFAAFQAAQGSRKARERKRTAARSTLLARIAVLREAGYLDEAAVESRGRIARKINGYEIQTTELLFSGSLESMDPHQLAATFASIVHEERRADAPPSGWRKFQALTREVDQAVRRFVSIEKSHGMRDTIKSPDFSIAPAVDAWSRGGSIQDLERLGRGDSGDTVRTLRMAIQMMRQLRTALDQNYPLAHRLEEAIVAINRDEVDAKRQFELG